MKDHAKMAAEMKQRLKVEELEENIDELEDVVEDVFPVLIVTVVFSLLILVVFLLRMYMRWSVENPSANKMDGKTVIITGATSGLGKATAIELAKRNAKVLITGREKIKVEALARNIRKKTGNARVVAHVLDLASLRSIRDFVDEINSTETSIHVLINNAAYMGPKAATDDGFERTFGVNYLGHFYLTNLLQDKLKKHAPSRIVNVLSDAYFSGQMDFEDLALKKGYSVYGAYARSKYCQAVFNLECHRRFFSSCVFTFGVHPGACATDLLRNYPGMWGNILRVVSRVMFKPPEDGCQTIIYCAVADGLRDFSGKIFANCKVLRTIERIKDKQMANQLWAVSCQMCGMPVDIPMEEPGGPSGAPEATEEEKKAQ